MQKKTYNGYKSYQNLEPGVDCRPFKLAREVGRVEPYTYPASEEQGSSSAVSACPLAQFCV